MPSSQCKHESDPLFITNGSTFSTTIEAYNSFRFNARNHLRGRITEAKPDSRGGLRESRVPEALAPNGTLVIAPDTADSGKIEIRVSRSISEDTELSRIENPLKKDYFSESFFEV